MVKLPLLALGVTPMGSWQLKRCVMRKIAIWYWFSLSILAQNHDRSDGNGMWNVGGVLVSGQKADQRVGCVIALRTAAIFGAGEHFPRTSAHAGGDSHAGDAGDVVAQNAEALRVAAVLCCRGRWAGGIVTQFQFAITVL